MQLLDKIHTLFTAALRHDHFSLTNIVAGSRPQKGPLLISEIITLCVATPRIWDMVDTLPEILARLRRYAIVVKRLKPKAIKAMRTVVSTSPL